MQEINKLKMQGFDPLADDAENMDQWTKIAKVLRKNGKHCQEVYINRLDPSILTYQLFN